MFTDDQLAMLQAPLDDSRIEHRRKGKFEMAYLETWDCIAKANEILGFEGWAYTVARLEATPHGWMAVVHLQVGSRESWVTREDVGFTAYASKAGEEPTADDWDMAIKGAVSDALKRCLRTFGTQFGNDLYDKGRASASASASASQPRGQPLQWQARMVTKSKENYGIDKAKVFEILGVKSFKEYEEWGPIDATDAWERIVDYCTENEGRAE